MYSYHKPQDTCFQSELHEPQAATIALPVAQESVTPPLPLLSCNSPSCKEFSSGLFTETLGIQAPS